MMPQANTFSLRFENIYRKPSVTSSQPVARTSATSIYRMLICEFVNFSFSTIIRHYPFNIRLLYYEHQNRTLS